MCIVAPNPVFRSIEKSHIDPPHAQSAETVAYKFVARPGQLLNGLHLEITNERPTGTAGPAYAQVRQPGDRSCSTFRRGFLGKADR